MQIALSLLIGPVVNLGGGTVQQLDRGRDGVAGCRDDFRNWVTLGLWPAKADEDQWRHNGAGGSSEIDSNQWSRRDRATVWSGACTIDRIIGRRRVYATDGSLRP